MDRQADRQVDGWTPVSGGESRSRHTRTCLSRQISERVWHRGGTERPEPRSRRVIADVGDLGECAWFLAVEALRALGKGEEGAWAWVKWHHRSLPIVLQCDGRESGVSTPAGRARAAKKKGVGGEVPGKKDHRAFAGSRRGRLGHAPCLWA